MVDRPALSRGEMEVARALWELGTGTVRQVHEALSEQRGMEFSTVQTYLRRLEEKGYVRVRKEGRTRIYSAKVRARTVIRETLDDLVDRLFGGDTLPLMKHLIEDRKISDAELQELRSMIDRLEEQGGES